MDKIHVHKTKKSICAHFAESPCSIARDIHVGCKWKHTNFLDLPASIDEALFYALLPASIDFFDNTLHQCFCGEKPFQFKNIEGVSLKQLWC